MPSQTHVHPVIEAIVTRRESGEIEVRCPWPAKVRWQRAPGEGLVPGSRLGLVRRDERTFELVLPAGARGRVLDVILADPWSRCEHGQLLGVLGEPVDDVADEGDPGGGTESTTGWAVRAPTDGTFYRRPSPGEPSYVERGAEIARGAAVGLIEVMKCFSPITFDPPAGIERGRVEEVVAGDAHEVRLGQELVRISLLEE